MHRLINGRCRSVEELKNAGYALTVKGWGHNKAKTVTNKGDGNEQSDL